jgi:DNA-binding CsgD family transcriptional regulator
VLRLLFQGKPYKQIAGELGITEGTVNQYGASITRKMKVSSIVQLVGLIDTFDIKL